MKTGTVFEQPGAKLIEIKKKMARGEYRVDEQAVADAILRRWRERQPSAAWILAAGRQSAIRGANGAFARPGVAAP